MVRPSVSPSTHIRLEFEGRGIVPVETGSFVTIDFSRNPNAVLYSNRLTTCVVVLIKNLNLETQKYDNVVTMAHFYPNNAYDEKQASYNLQLCLGDFQEKGGVINKSTSMQVLCGGFTPQLRLEDGPRGSIERAIMQNKINEETKFTSHQSSIIENFGVKNFAEVFVDRNSTQIVKIKDGSLQFVTNPNESLTRDFLSRVDNFLPDDFIHFSNFRASQLADFAQRVEGINLQPMSAVLESYSRHRTQRVAVDDSLQRVK